MKIVRDEPQQLLVLETPVFRLPPAAVGCAWLGIGILVFLFGSFGLLEALWNGRRPEPLELGLQLLVPGAFVLVVAAAYFRLRRRLRFPQQLRVDRYAGELELAEVGLLGGSSTLRLRLDTIERIRVATALVKPQPADFKAAAAAARGPRLGLRVGLEWREEGGPSRSRTVEMAVDGVDRREEVVDLAFRLGKAAGLFYSRVLRSDPRDVELELLRERTPGSESLPLFEKPAEYARDVVLPQALRTASREQGAPFVPADWKGDMAVESWEPRVEVRFRRRLGIAAVGCLPFTLLVLTGPLFFLFGSPRPEDRLIASAVLGVFGLVFGGLAILVVATALPRRVTLDWTSGRVEWRGAFRSRSVALSDVREIELRGIRQYHSSKNSSYHSYRCAVVAHLRPNPAEPAPGPGEAELVETDRFREDPDTPYRMALPLATELAAALGVPRRVTDFS